MHLYTHLCALRNYAHLYVVCLELEVCMLAWLFACLLACLHVCVCLPVCLPACLPARLPAHLLVFMYVCRSVFLPACLHTPSRNAYDPHCWIFMCMIHTFVGSLTEARPLIYLLPAHDMIREAVTCWGCLPITLSGQ